MRDKIESLWYIPSAFGGAYEPCSFYRVKSASLRIWERIDRSSAYLYYSKGYLPRLGEELELLPNCISACRNTLTHI